MLVPGRVYLQFSLLDKKKHRDQEETKKEDAASDDSTSERSSSHARSSSLSLDLVGGVDGSKAEVLLVSFDGFFVDTRIAYIIFVSGVILSDVLLKRRSFCMLP